jgi:RHS repeat-associated protein
LTPFAVNSFTYSYDSLNRRTNATLEDGSYWQYGYDDRDELTGANRRWSSDSSFVAGQQFVYDYDNIGNRKTAASGGDSLGGNLRSESYATNSLNQYTSRTVPGWVQTIGSANASANVILSATNGACVLASRKGEYFRAEVPVDNNNSTVWVALTNLAALPGGGSSDIKANNTGHLLLPKSQQILEYDLDGNLTFDGIWIYEWDGENRLAAMTMTNVTGLADSERLLLEFKYDLQGRRVEKKVSHHGGSPWSLDSDTLFVYDGWNLIAELSSPSTVLRTYMWGLDLSGTMAQAGGVGGLLGVFEISNNQVSNCHFAANDGNGNITALVKANDSLPSAQYEYSSFGEALRSTGPMAKANPFHFSTKFVDHETGLVYYGYRYYSPATGRWISRDPSQEKGGNNLFGFCNNNPGNKIDTDGRIIMEPNFSIYLNEMADWLELAARAQAVGDSAAFRMAHMFANFAAKNAMKAILAEEGGAAAAGAVEAGYASTEVLGVLGGAVGGAGIGVGAGLLFVYAVDLASEGIGAMIKQVSDANCAIIDYWADPDTK